MQYTPGQLRNTVGLSKETFRHWKRVLPAFSNRKGHSPSFSLGDVLASAILRRLTDSCGIRVGHLTEVATKIFEICNEASWATLEKHALLIELSGGSCRIIQNAADIPMDSTVVVCPLRTVINELQNDLLRSQSVGEQGQLLFSPNQAVREPVVRRQAK